MDTVNTLRRYGLFDARVPRYTSYPPANRFEPGVGMQHQRDWLGKVPPNEPVSIYVHIPFCRRLCWFCACRTQGTRSLAPVKGYVDDLLREGLASRLCRLHRHDLFGRVALLQAPALVVDSVAVSATVDVIEYTPQAIKLYH